MISEKRREVISEKRREVRSKKRREVRSEKRWEDSIRMIRSEKKTAIMGNVLSLEDVDQQCLE